MATTPKVWAPSSLEANLFSTLASELAADTVSNLGTLLTSALEAAFVSPLSTDIGTAVTTLSAIGSSNTQNAPANSLLGAIQIVLTSSLSVGGNSISSLIASSLTTESLNLGAASGGTGLNTTQINVLAASVLAALIGASSDAGFAGSLCNYSGGAIAVSIQDTTDSNALGTTLKSVLTTTLNSSLTTDLGTAVVNTLSSDLLASTLNTDLLSEIPAIYASVIGNHNRVFSSSSVSKNAN